ncbi:hypothetical protein HFP89_12110 [Wenzhouxiangella sp. XN79A]|uniref:hypothetical protein n=1 Tax=Wenzhouxiangella sp. XN79A TaxID=2724193 RepID=UPI00144A6956|nr:hypothetical protein [Wenzhouxiangella sp. XN79A]NKI35906.1 hypothetical protein [Wenzhouxiangella sp. XN79A]
MKRTRSSLQFVLAAMLAVTAGIAAAQQHPLAQRAAESDVVVLAQLERTDYEYTRGFPIDGRAWFSTLLAYKAPRIIERFIVKESGLKDIECYFPERVAGQEGPRYLLFLLRDPEDGWRGHPDGCALEVLVGADNRYALRWPQPGLGGENGRGDEAVQALVEPMSFQGPRSRIDASDLLAHQREARAESQSMRVDGTDLVPTRGIELGAFRALIRDGLVDEDGALQARERRRAATLRQALDEADRSGDG